MKNTKNLQIKIERYLDQINEQYKYLVQVVGSLSKKTRDIVNVEINVLLGVLYGLCATLDIDPEEKIKIEGIKK